LINIELKTAVQHVLRADQHLAPVVRILISKKVFLASGKNLVKQKGLVRPPLAS